MLLPSLSEQRLAQSADSDLSKASLGLFGLSVAPFQPEAGRRLFQRGQTVLLFGRPRTEKQEATSSKGTLDWDPLEH